MGSAALLIGNVKCQVFRGLCLGELKKIQIKFELKINTKKHVFSKMETINGKQFSRIIHLLIIFVNGMRYIVNIQYVLIINEICLDRPNNF